MKVNHLLCAIGCHYLLSSFDDFMFCDFTETSSSLRKTKSQIFTNSSVRIFIYLMIKSLDVR